MPTIISIGGLRKVRASGGVVAARRNQLDRVAAEHGQVAIVLLPLRQIPGVVAVGLGPIAKLMPTQRILGRSGHIEIAVERDLVRVEVQLAQQVANAKQHAPLVVAGHHDVRALCAEVKAFGRTGLVLFQRTRPTARRSPAACRPVRPPLRPAVRRARRARLSTARRCVLHFVDEHANGLLLARRKIGRRDDDCASKIRCQGRQGQQRGQTECNRGGEFHRVVVSRQRIGESR